MADHEQRPPAGGGTWASPRGREEPHDGELVAACARRDQVAFRRLLDRHVAAVVMTARRILDDEAEAEDVAQEAMLRLWSLAATLEVPEHGIRAWLKRVAANLALDRIRARRRLDVTDQPPEVAEPPTQATGLDEASRTARVRAALSRLPERQRHAVTLFHFDGLSQSEVAHLMHVSEEAVESLLSRGRRALKSALQDDWRMLLNDDVDRP